MLLTDSLSNFSTSICTNVNKRFGIVESTLFCASTDACGGGAWGVLHLEKACRLPAAVLLLLLVLRSIAAVTLWKFPFFKMAKFEFESKLTCDLDYFTVKRADLNGELYYDSYNSIFKSSIQVDNVNVLNIQIFKEFRRSGQTMNEKASLHVRIENANPDEAMLMEISFELAIKGQIVMVKNDLRAPFGSLIVASEPFESPNLPAEVRLRIAVKVLNDGSDMTAKLSQMFLDKDSADVAIVCRDGKLKAHKFVLALRSPVFKAMFKMSLTTEVTKGVIEITDVDHATMTVLLKYMYTDFIHQKDITMPLLFAADKYDVQPLVTLSEKTILRTLSLENAMDILVTSKSSIFKKIEDGAREFIISNAGKVVKNPDWDTIRSTDPQLAASILEECVFQQKEKESKMEN
jgi:speckle-type POZ protein